jgi:hypothetical protein
LLGFDGIEYKCGSYFDNKSPSGTQIDLIYERADKCTTFVEIKYSDKPVGIEVIPEFEKKMALYPRARIRSAQRVLVAANGADLALTRRGYFDRVITLEDLFRKDIW